MDDLLAAVKPRLRGWLHLAAFPAAVIGGLVLVLFAPSDRARLALTVYAVTSSLLFGISALYHRGRWSPRVHAVLARLDHANIFLIIAGTYTPFAVLVLPDGPGDVVLAVVWAGALLGVAFRVLWLDAPRWLYVPAYLALGWTAVFVLPEMVRRGGVVVTLLLLAGGALYSMGGLVYAVRRPDPSPRWFGFHEVFHALTIVAFTTQYVAVSLVAY
jgi:hemolysin III